MIPNKRSTHIICCFFAGRKPDRIAAIEDVITVQPPPHPPAGPPGGKHRFYAPPYGNMVGGGGTVPCIVVVIKCPQGIGVFHFRPGDPIDGSHGGDNPAATINGYSWPSGCHAIVCGGNDRPQSNCLAESVITALRKSGITIDAVSPKDSCGWSVKKKKWYQTPKEE